jgi:hypothetical protein
MCDLSADEKDAILQYVNALTELIDKVRASSRSIEERSWMEHDELTQLLGQLADTATEAGQWVHDKVHATHG